jgi:hypothetical protein
MHEKSRRDLIIGNFIAKSPHLIIIIASTLFRQSKQKMNYLLATQKTH